MEIISTNIIRNSIADATNKVIGQKTRLGLLFIDITVLLNANNINANNNKNRQFITDLSTLSSKAISIAKGIAMQLNSLTKLQAMIDDCMEMSEEDYDKIFEEVNNQFLDRDIRIAELHNKYYVLKSVATF